MSKFIILLLLVSNYFTYSQTDSLKYYWMKSEYDMLINLGEKLISKDSANAEDYILIANAYKSTLESQKAVKILLIGVEKHPTSNDLKYNLASIYYTISENKKCISIIDSLCLVDSLNKKYLILELKAYQKDKKYQKTLDISNKLISIDSTKAVFYYKSAYFYNKLKNPKASLEMIDKSLNLDSSYIPAYKLAALIYTKQHKYDTSLSYINKAIELDSTKIEFYRDRGNIYYYKDDTKNALPDLLRYTKVDTSDSKSIFKIGVCYMEQFEYEKGKEAFRKTYKLDSLNYKMSQYLGVMYAEFSELDSSVFYLEKSYKLIQPDEKVVNMLNKQLAGVYFRNREYKKAIMFYKEIQKVEYNFKNDYFIGESYYFLKKYDKALKYYNRVPANKSWYTKIIDSRKATIKEEQFFEKE